jgi:hypothetical protein
MIKMLQKVVQIRFLLQGVDSCNGWLDFNVNKLYGLDEGTI